MSKHTLDDFSDIEFSDEKLNNTTRVPIAILLDLSGSMSNEIPLLKHAVIDFFASLQKDPIASQSALVSIIGFGSAGEETQFTDFIEAEQFTPTQLNLETLGLTATGSAIKYALNKLDAKKQELQQSAIDYYQPWLVLMTDGGSTDPETLKEQIKQIHSLINSKKLNVVCVGIGEGVNEKELSSIHPGKFFIQVKDAGTDFSKFFEWLGKSVVAMSNSVAGAAPTIEQPSLPVFSFNQ
jgi:uncharacterized protein YegL